DFHVTGVQTCALPIYTVERSCRRFCRDGSGNAACSKVVRGKRITAELPMLHIRDRSLCASRRYSEWTKSDIAIRVRLCIYSNFFSISDTKGFTFEFRRENRNV